MTALRRFITVIKALLIVACISGLLQSHRDQRVDGIWAKGKVTTNCRKFWFLYTFSVSYTWWGMVCLYTSQAWEMNIFHINTFPLKWYPVSLIQVDKCMEWVGEWENQFPEHAVPFLSMWYSFTESSFLYFYEQQVILEEAKCLIW